MILFPNAKINIGLDIIRRRPDGYHDIETMMIPVNWCDVLEIVPGKSSSATLAVSGRGVDCPPEKNLVMKAYNLMNSKIPLPPVDIYLNKVIPDGAGLGGGSADAAFTLTGLNELLALGYTRDQLAAMASELGADCPFFIYNQPMMCSGTGTDMRPDNLHIPPLAIAIVKPADSVSTAEAYAGVAPEEPTIPLRDRLLLPMARWRHSISNDFEASVTAKVPEILSIKHKLYDMGAIYASMSGSGSAVYGLFECDILADDISNSFPGCDTFVGR